MKKYLVASKKHRAWLFFKENILDILLIGLLLAANRFFYCLARLISHSVFDSPSDFLNISLPFETKISYDVVDVNNIKNCVMSSFIIPYFLAFIYWIIIPFVIRTVVGRKVFYEFCAATLLAEIAGFFVLAFLPTRQDPTTYKNILEWIYGKDVIDPNLHPVVLPDKINADFYGWNKFTGYIINMIYKGDLPDNLSPSFHILATVLPFFAFCCKTDKTKKINKAGLIVSLGMLLLVSTATIVVRQHCLMDIWVAFLITSLCYLFVRYVWKLGKTFEKMQNIILFNVFCLIDTKTMKTNKQQLQPAKQKWFKVVIFIILWIILFGTVLYFGVISLLIGDPFAHIWENDHWTYFNYLPPITS